MKILVANDDGINAPGIYCLVKELLKEHEVVVVAPRDQQSAKSHSITIHKPMNIKKEKLEGLDCEAYSVNGTPADCVRFGMDVLAKGADMVISGINKGYNIGTDIIYSGTVSAAMEAAIYSIPSIAMSLEVTDWDRDDEDYSLAAEYALKIANMSREKYNQPNVVINVNVPAKDKKDIKGLKVCKMGNRTYSHTYTLIEDDESPETYSICGTANNNDNKDDDIFYLNQGYVTITPLHYDLTNFKIIKSTSEIFGEKLLEE